MIFQQLTETANCIADRRAFLFRGSLQSSFQRPTRERWHEFADKSFHLRRWVNSRKAAIFRIRTPFEHSPLRQPVYDSACTNGSKIGIHELGMF